MSSRTATQGMTRAEGEEHTCDSVGNGKTTARGNGKATARGSICAALDLSMP